MSYYMTLCCFYFIHLINTNFACTTLYNENDIILSASFMIKLRQSILNYLLNLTKNPTASSCKLNTQIHMHTQSHTQENMHFLGLFSEMVIILLNLFTHYLRKPYLSYSFSYIIFKKFKIH